MLLQGVGGAVGPGGARRSKSQKERLSSRAGRAPRTVGDFYSCEINLPETPQGLKTVFISLVHRSVSLKPITGVAVSSAQGFAQLKVMAGLSSHLETLG